ncbi:Uncharacterised protein [uncultured archaeon]|nr:Uncharacterised protein [uncultured archaeon]
MQIFPTFIAVMKSRASPPLTSPMMMRSGLILSEFFTKSCIVTPSPVTSRAQFSSVFVFNSSVSSIATILCPEGRNENMELRRVVFPAAGLPAISMFAGFTPIPST